MSDACAIYLIHHTWSKTTMLKAHLTDSIELYKGQRVIIRFDGTKCIHPRDCELGEPEGDNSAPLEKRDGPSKVQPSPSGPLIVETSVDIVTAAGKTVTRTQKAALCRCGHSSKKPFCDGTHQRVGFNKK